MRIILASKSPRRKELLDLMKIKYEVIASDEKEKIKEGLTIQEKIKEIAYQKAKTVFEKTQEDRIVIGADTIVYKENKIYGKPKNEEEANKMLTELQNGKHEVMTALVVLMQKNNEYKEFKEINITQVYLKPITEKEIKDWINEGEYIDKAGAYAIQSKFCVYIEKIIGDYNSVVGLPLNKLYDILKNIL